MDSEVQESGYNGASVQKYYSTLSRILVTSMESPLQKGDKQLLEKVQHRFTQLFDDLRTLRYNERLRLQGSNFGHLKKEETELI